MRHCVHRVTTVVTHSNLHSNEYRMKILLTRRQQLQEQSQECPESPSSDLSLTDRVEWKEVAIDSLEVQDPVENSLDIPVDPTTKNLDHIAETFIPATVESLNLVYPKQKRPAEEVDDSRSSKKILS